MSLPNPPNIVQGQMALDPINGIVYYKDENNNLISTTWSWLQDNETQISTEDNVTISSNLTVGGDLVIAGNTVSLNVAEVLIEDNILVLNSNVTGSPILNAGIEVERGTSTNVEIRWNESLDKWQFTNDGTTYLDLNSIVANSVTLGLHTVGDYVTNLAAGTGVSISQISGEGATPTISIGQDVATSATPTFARVVAPLTGNVTGDVTGNVTGNVVGNVTGNLTGNVTGTVSDISNHSINALSDVTITSTANGDFLRWSGSQWVNDAVDLSSDTVGDYVKNLVQGNGLTISNNSGEGATPGIAIDTSIVQTRVANITDTEIGYLDGVTSAIQTQINTKAPTADPTFTGTVSGISKSMVGLGSVDNTADTAKPVSTAQQTALNLKANIADPTFTGTVGGVTKSMVGLGSVDNTSDADKPVSTAQQTALNLKANSATPTFTGMVTAPYLTVSGVQIDASGPSDTNVLKYSSALNKYVPGVASTVASLDDLTDVIIGSATPNQVLVYQEGGIWAAGNAPIPSVEGSAYFSTIGDGTLTTFTITHNLATRDVFVSTTEANSPYSSFSTYWEATTDNSIILYFDSAPSASSVRVAVYAALAGSSFPDLEGTTYTGIIGNGIDDTIPVVHSLGTRDVFIQARQAASPYQVIDATWEVTTTNIVTFTFDTPPVLDSVKVYIYSSVIGSPTTSLSGLTDVNYVNPDDNDILSWDEATSQWIPQAFIAAVSDINDIDNVVITSATPNNYLQYNGSQWVNSYIDLGTNTSGNYVKNLVAGTGIAVTNNSGEGATPTIAITSLVVTTSDTGTVTSTMIANDTIVNADVNSAASIAYSKLNLNNSVDYTDLKDGVAKSSFRSTLNAQTGTTYTLALADLAKLVTLSNAGAITLTVPLESSVAFAIGDRIDLLQKGAGQVTIVGAGGVTVNATPGLKLRAQWSSATLIKLDTNSWVLLGDLQA